MCHIFYCQASRWARGGEGWRLRGIHDRYISVSSRCIWYTFSSAAGRLCVEVLYVFLSRQALRTIATMITQVPESPEGLKRQAIVCFGAWLTAVHSFLHVVGVREEMKTHVSVVTEAPLDTPCRRYEPA